MYSRISGTGSGIAPVVNITFPFADKAHVKASVDGFDVPFIWTGASQITFLNEVGNTSEWLVYRDTSPAAKLVDFVDTAVLTEDDLDLQATQAQYREQELDDRLTIAQAAAEGAQETADEALETAQTVGTSLSNVPNATAHAASRAVLALLSTSAPAYLAEAGREGEFVFNSSNLSAEVAADTAQGHYVAPTSDPTGASGAWVRSNHHEFHNLRHYGAKLDGVTADDAAIIAVNALAAIPGQPKRVLFPAGTKCLAASTVTFSADDLEIFGIGAELKTTNPAAGFYSAGFSGDRIKVHGLHVNNASGIDNQWVFDVTGEDVLFDNKCKFEKVEGTDGILGFVRVGANGFHFLDSEIRGSLGIQQEGSDFAYLGSRFFGRQVSGTDDCIAIKGYQADTKNGRIENCYFDNFIAMVSIGSQIGARMTGNDPTYSLGVYNIVIGGNVGNECGAICYIKPGSNQNVSDGTDVRDGTVQGINISNNTLYDPLGKRFITGIKIWAMRGCRVLGVKGRGNIVIARANSNASGRETGMLECFIDKIAANAGLTHTDLPGTAPSRIEDVDVEISYTDPFQGVANGAATPVAYDGLAAGSPAPGYPVLRFCNFELNDITYGSMDRIRVTGNGDGCANDGCVFGQGLSEQAIYVDLRLKNYGISSGTNAGIAAMSVQRVAPTTRLTSPAGRYPYRFPVAGVGGIRCPELSEDVTLYPVDVPAGTGRTSYPWAAKRDCVLMRIDLGTTNTQAGNDTNYTTIQWRNNGGSTGGTFFQSQSKATAGSGSIRSFSLTAGLRSNVLDANMVTTAADRTEMLFDKNDVLRAIKVDSGTGAALNEGKLTIEVAPF